jgi:hypothetical protein
MACVLSLALREGLMGRMNWMPETTSAAAWLIFLATYAVMALGKIPVYRIDVRFIQVSRKPREKLSKTGLMMYSKNVRSPVLM